MRPERDKMTIERDTGIIFPTVALRKSFFFFLGGGGEQFCGGSPPSSLP